MAKKDPQSYLDTSKLREDLGRRTVRGGATTAVAQALKGLLEVGSTFVLARLLLPGDFGLIGMVIVVTGFISMFKDLGLSMATIQREDITHEQVTALFWVNVGVSVVITAVTAALAPVIAWVYDEPRLTWITIALAVGFLFGGLTVQHQAILRRNMRFGAIAAAELAQIALSVGVAIAAAWIGWDHWALVAKELVAAVVGAVGVWLLCGWRPGRPAGADDMRALLGFGGNLTGFNIVNYFARNLDDFLIGRLFGARSLGLYQKAYEILMVPLRQINAPLASVAIPALSRLVEEPEKYRRTYLRLLEKVLMVTMPLGAFLVASADWVVLTVFGDQWMEAVPLFRWLGLAIFVQPIGNSCGWLFVSQDRTGHMFRWGLIGSAITIASFLAGLPWGPLGVAVAYSAVFIVIHIPLLLWYVGRRGPVRTADFYRTAAPFALAGVVSLGALYLYRHYGWFSDVAPLNLLISAAVTLLSAGATVLALPGGRRALADVRELVAMLRPSST